jgi:hypothetical protein
MIFCWDLHQMSIKLTQAVLWESIAIRDRWMGSERFSASLQPAHDSSNVLPVNLTENRIVMVVSEQ